MDLDGSTPVPATAEPSRTPATGVFKDSQGRRQAHLRPGVAKFLARSHSIHVMNLVKPIYRYQGVGRYTDALVPCSASDGRCCQVAPPKMTSSSTAVIRAFDRLRLTTPGGTPIPAAPTASQVVAQVPVLDVAVDANPAPADDFTFSAPETGAAVPPSPTAPALTPLALPVLSPTGATEGPCESAPGTPTHKLSARPPANTPMGSAAGAAVASLDMKTLRSKLGVEPSPGEWWRPLTP